MKHITFITTLLLSSLALAQDSGDGSAPAMGGGHGGHGGQRGNQPAADGQGAGAGGHGGRGKGHNRSPCAQFLHAENVLKVLSNTTELAHIQQQNPQRAQRLQDEKANATALVSSAEKNATFVQECQTMEVQRNLRHACGRLRHLEQQAGNSTDTNSARAKQQLADLEKNQTLVADCKNMGSQQGGGKGGKGGHGGAQALPAEAGKSAKKNGAESVRAYGGGLFALSASVLLAVLAL